MEFSNRVAVITGGGSGIGRAVAAAMARRDVGAVALVDISEAVEDIAEKLNAEAGRTVAIPFQGDTTDDKFRASVSMRSAAVRPGVAVRPRASPGTTWPCASTS
jgi:NAD(P)-dependent dehydrogenase (short-subunit alcohol dehydrogenase family)